MKRMVILVLLLAGVGFGVSGTFKWNNSSLYISNDNTPTLVPEFALPSTLRKSHVRGFNGDGITYDNTCDRFWTTREGTSTLYQTDRKDAILTTSVIALATPTAETIELEGICIDADGSLWIIEDFADEATLFNINRPTNDDNITNYNTKIDLSATITSSQDVCYDSLTNTFWIAQNSDKIGSKDDYLFNVSKTGTIIRELDVSSIVVTNESLQSVWHDYFDDTLWIAARTGFVYNITKSGVLIRKYQIDASNGPSGVCIAPYIPFAVTNPVMDMAMNDPAGSVVFDEVGDHEGTFTNDAGTPGSITQDSEGGIVFNGVQDQVRFGDLALVGDFTICAFIKPADLASVVLFGDAENADWLRIESATTITYKAANGTQFSSTAMGVTLVADTYQFFVFRSTGGVIDILKDSVSGGTIASGITATFTPDRIGNKANGNEYSGAMKDVLIYNRSLTQSEINQLFTGDAVSVIEGATTGGGYRGRYDGGGR